LQVFDERAVGIDHCETIAVVKIGDDHVPYKGSLTHPGFSEDRHVLTANVSGDADQRIVAMFCAEESVHRCVELYTLPRDPSCGEHHVRSSRTRWQFQALKCKEYARERNEIFQVERKIKELN